MAGHQILGCFDITDMAISHRNELAFFLLTLIFLFLSFFFLGSFFTRFIILLVQIFTNFISVLNPLKINVFILVLATVLF